MHGFFTPFGFGITLDAPHHRALARTRAALLAEGFGIVSEVDLGATLQARLGADIGSYVLLGVCSAPLAFQALREDRDVGLLLPCTVAVYDRDDGRTVVTAMDPVTLFATAANRALMPLGAEAASRLRRAFETVMQSESGVAAPMQSAPAASAEVVEEIC
jgi:uncharacterized protein (DUF302 family)